MTEKFWGHLNKHFPYQNMAEISIDLVISVQGANKTHPLYSIVIRILPVNGLVPMSLASTDPSLAS